MGSNPTGGMDVCLLCCVLSGRGLCDELITRPEESHRLWCVVVCDLKTSWMRRPWPTGGCRASNILESDEGHRLRSTVLNLLFQTYNCLPSTYLRQNKDQFSGNADRQWPQYRLSLSLDLKQHKTLFSFYFAFLYTVQDVEMTSDAHHKDMGEWRWSFIHSESRH